MKFWSAKIMNNADYLCYRQLYCLPLNRFEETIVVKIAILFLKIQFILIRKANRIILVYHRLKIFKNVLKLEKRS